MAGRDDILTQVQRIVQQRLGGSDAVVYLFGSFARGDERRSSDIDIGVWSADAFLGDLVAQLQSDFEESTVPYRVEVVDLRSVSEAFRAKVQAEGKVWNV